MNRNGRVFSDTVRRCRPGIIAACLCFAVAAAVFYIYRLPAEPFVYAAVLTVFVLLVLLAVSYAKARAKAKRREQMLRAALTENSLPEPDTLAEEDLQELVRLLRQELTRLRNEYADKSRDELDYYTTWVHQIKTPIAVMRMQLGGAETENARELEAELFRIEQYVDMVLQYIRLGGDSSDLVIREYPLDELIREAVRKFAPQFVAKRLSLSYGGTDAVVVTDKKWFSCILEQILSNAIKYTPSGGITISVENGVLSIADTGIGIAAEDVPRIFEKGFTGENGRIDRRASGLGLYLCKKAASLLRIPLSVESCVGQGSRFSLGLKDIIR